MSESFWKGVFSPNMTKRIGTVKFVPLSQMSARDWRWLDFDNTRTVAQNRIARMVMSGQLRGFFQVILVDKAAKNEYFWPANQPMVDEFAETDDATFFIQEAEVLTENQAREALEDLRNGMLGMTLPIAMAILGLLAALAAEQTQQELQNFTEEYFSEVEQDDISLLLSTLMMWEMSLDEAEAVLDDLPESDEADTIRDWINDQVAEIQSARLATQPIAAGRGIR